MSKNDPTIMFRPSDNARFIKRNDGLYTVEYATNESTFRYSIDALLKYGFKDQPFIDPEVDAKPTEPDPWDVAGAKLARWYKKIRAAILLTCIFTILGIWKFIELLIWSISQ